MKHRIIADKTPWPSHDSDGNSLSHNEDCAWRFGGVCDCRTDTPATTEHEEEEELTLYEA